MQAPMVAIGPEDPAAVVASMRRDLEALQVSVCIVTTQIEVSECKQSHIVTNLTLLWWQCL